MNFCRLTLTIFLTASLGWAIMPCSLTAQSDAQSHPEISSVPEFEGLVERWEDLTESIGVPGFSVAVVKEGQILALEAFGARNVEGDPATVDSMYYIASATKPMVAMVTLMLVEEGKVELDQPVKKYLPAFQLADKKAEQQITVRDLLTHKPGLSDFRIVWHDAYTGQINDDLYFRLLSSIEPRNEVTYSNVHYTLLGRVIESVEGKSWKDVLDEKLFTPAGMNRTTAYASEVYGDENVADPILELDRKFVTSPVRKTDQTMHAAGGVGTTARDSARWLLLNLNRGEIHGNRLLSEELFDEYLSMQAELPEFEGRIRQQQGFALGWQRGNYRGQRSPLLMHGGGYVGAASYYAFLPEENIGVAVLTNVGGSGNALTAVVMIDVFDRLLGIEAKDDLVPQYKSLAERMRERPEMKQPEGENPASDSDYLTLPVKKYVGQYSSRDWGTIELILRDSELVLQLGAMPAQLFANGVDQFRFWIQPKMTGTGRFVTEDSSVTAIELKLRGTTIRFESPDLQQNLPR